MGHTTTPLFDVAILGTYLGVGALATYATLWMFAQDLGAVSILVVLLAWYVYSSIDAYYWQQKRNA